MRAFDQIGQTPALAATATLDATRLVATIFGNYSGRESNLFGITAQVYSNFTEYAWNNNDGGDAVNPVQSDVGLRSTGRTWANKPQQASLLNQAKLINALPYVGKTDGITPNWRIRVGTRDRDTSFTVAYNISRALKADAKVKNVDYPPFLGPGPRRQLRRAGRLHLDRPAARRRQLRHPMAPRVGHQQRRAQKPRTVVADATSSSLPPRRPQRLSAVSQTLDPELHKAAMKRMTSSPCFVLAAAGLAGFAALPAGAQTSVAPPPPAAPSSVTLYGVLDASAYSRQLSGDPRVKALQSGGMTTSRFGLAGSEDMGGGLRGLFDLSSFIRLDSGDSGRSATDSFWGRYAYVGVSSADLGAVRLGRISTATFLSEIFFGAFLDSTTLGPYLLHTFLPSAGQPMLTGNGLLDSAWNNSISYTLPALSFLPGLTASLQVAAGEGGTAGRRVGGGATYRTDVYGATFTFDNVRNGSLSVGAPTAALATAARPQYTATDVRTYQGGAYYDFKVVRIWAQLNQTTFSNTTPTEIRLRTSALSGTVPIGLGSVIAEWAHTNERRTGTADLRRDTASVGYDYFLSKRTDLYAVALHDKVTNLASGNGVAAGIRHRF